jgi:DNA-binding MarR family transcriptional regulator
VNPSPSPHPDAATAELDATVDAVLLSSRALVAVSARSIAAAKGVTLPQFRMLVVLSEASTNLTALAGALDVAPSTAMRMVDRLEAAELVRRTVYPDNRRETHLALTAAGRRTVRTVTARRRRDLAVVLTRLSAGERTALAGAMTAFARAADTLWPGEADTIS